MQLHNDINKIIIDKVLNEFNTEYFCTLSSLSVFTVEINKFHIVVETKCRCIYIEKDNLYLLIAAVIAYNSFRVKDFKYEHQYCSYLLPIIKHIFSVLNYDYEHFIPPIGGWRNEPSNKEELYLLNKHLIDKNYIELNQAPMAFMMPFKKTVSQKKIPVNKNKKKEVVEVFYATNRKKTSVVDYFSGEVAREIHYGVSNVVIPKNNFKHKKLKAVSEFINVKLLGKATGDFCIGSMEKLDKNKFNQDLQQKSGGKSIVLFIHGYNVSFKDALFKSAQMKYDLNYKKPMVLFSWPSAAKPLLYVKDKENATYSAKALSDFLKQLSELGIEEINVVAHSMGAYCFAESMRASSSSTKQIHNLVLAAADVQQDAFLSYYVDKIRDFCANITLYVSKSDRALVLSNMVNDSNRIGDTRNGVFVTENIETVDMSGVDKCLFSCRHSYVFDSDKGLDDLYAFLINGLSAKDRRLKHLLNTKSQFYWAVQES